MANTTQKVAMATTPWGDSGIYRIPAATATTFYGGSMVARDSLGNAVHCDDTAGIVFDGIVDRSVRLTINSDDTVASMTLDQTKQLHVERPWRFTCKIAAAAVGDEDKAVYALYDDEVSYSTSNSILVGWVDQVLSATSVLVKPAYAPFENIAVDSNTLTFDGLTGANTIVMPDNLADALSVKEGSNAYLTFVTTNSSEAINLKKNTTVTGTLALTSTSATAVSIGPNGATNPTLSIICNVSSQAGGVSITGGADAVGGAIAAIGSNTNEPLKINGKGSGTVSIATTSTGGTIVRTKVSTVAVGGTAIGNANAVDEGFYYVTGADDTAAVVLPASVVGKQVEVKNTVANKILIVFPPVSSQINGNGANNAYNMPAGSTRRFICASTSLWYTDPETIA